MKQPRSVALLLIALAPLSVFAADKSAPETPPPSAGEVARTKEFGMYFHRESDRTSPLPKFEDVQDKLPEPILDAHPDWIDMYRKCWSLTFAHIKKPLPGSPFVASWLDVWFASHPQYVYQWDTCFMMMFARYGNSQFPFIQSLDNFYSRQRENGYICREIDNRDGAEMKYGDYGAYDDPEGWKNSVNPPLFAWSEYEYFKVTGDKSRFAAVLPVLEKYVEFLNRDGNPKAPRADWLQQGRRSSGTPHLLYWNTGLGCGMDNTPKPTGKGAGWVDMSSQMVLQYRMLAAMHRELGNTSRATACEAEANAISDRINRWCWDEKDGFYYDVTADGTKFRKKTMSGFWPMLAGIASPAQVDRLVAHLRDEKEFWRPFPFPVLAADEKEYKANGSYWLGGVWAPTNLMVIKGLEAYGREDFATEASEKYLTAMAKVFKATGTVWENYMPESMKPGNPACPDYGWSYNGPITMLIENVLGFRPDAVNNRLAWRLTRADRHGIRKLRFGAVATDLVYDGKGGVEVKSSAPYTLVVNGVSHDIPAGETSFSASPAAKGAK